MYYLAFYKLKIVLNGLSCCVVCRLAGMQLVLQVQSCPGRLAELLLLLRPGSLWT